ncbi:hypothetical protein CDAR_594221 [Caerostris darwini]|uniref:Uncharacterized protein n=1 Tax=Caerostris darwini TaxID=1538125 RepID=A0AAV4PAD5_9ARAC|nr:hypothetical protein CDAR_594221 [Caerostris darwini]
MFLVIIAVSSSVPINSEKVPKDVPKQQRRQLSTTSLTSRQYGHFWTTMELSSAIQILNIHLIAIYFSLSSFTFLLEILTTVTGIPGQNCQIQLPSSLVLCTYKRNIRWYVNIESMLSGLKIVLMENKISMEFVECLLTISKDLFQKEEHGIERVTDRDNADTWTHSVLSRDLNICSEVIEAMRITPPCFHK